MKLHDVFKSAHVVCLIVASGLLSACSSLHQSQTADAPPYLESGVWVAHSLK